MRGLSLVVASGDHSSSRCAGLSLSRPLSLWSTGSSCAGSVVVAHGPSCSAACGIFPDQSSNPCLLHWQADSQPLRHQESPVPLLLRVSYSTMSPVALFFPIFISATLAIYQFLEPIKLFPAMSICGYYSPYLEQFSPKLFTLAGSASYFRSQFNFHSLREPSLTTCLIQNKDLLGILVLCLLPLQH